MFQNCTIDEENFEVANEQFKRGMLITDTIEFYKETEPQLHNTKN